MTPIIQHPWQEGPTELIEFALERMHKGSDFDRRLAFLILDVGVETLFKTFLNLSESVMQFHTKRGERLTASEGNFHELLRGVQNAHPKKALNFTFAHIEHYHDLRNTLYHEGNRVTSVRTSDLERYAKLAVGLLHEYLEVDLLENLNAPVPQIGVDHEDDLTIIDTVEVKLSFGRYRIDRLKSHAIRALCLDTNIFETPVKPFLRAVVAELTLPVEFASKSGTEKNTQILGKDVINTLKAHFQQSSTNQIPGSRVNKIDEHQYFDAGNRIKLVRDEIGLKPSEFKELLGIQSEFEYQAIENQKQEASSDLLKKVSDVSGVNLEWLKHGTGDQYNIGAIHFNPIENDLKYCENLKPQEYFLIISENSLQVGIVAQRSQYNFQTIKTGVSLDFWDWVEAHWVIPAFYRFLSQLSDSWHDTRGIILPDQIGQDLLEGNIHFLTAQVNAQPYGGDLLYDLLDIDETRGGVLSYPTIYEGNWMPKVHEYFKKYLKEL